MKPPLDPPTRIDARCAGILSRVATLALLLLAGWAPATRVEARTAPRGFTALSPLAKLAFENGVLRLEGTVSWSAMVHTLTAQEQIAVNRGLGPVEGGRLDQCSLLLRSATVLLHADGRQAESFWWSPAADAGFAFRWRYRRGVWRLIGAVPTTGERVRTDAPHASIAPAWAQSVDTAQLGRALAETVRRTDAAVAAGGLKPPLADSALRPATCARAVLAQFSVDTGAAAAPAARAERAAHWFLQRPPTDGEATVREEFIQSLNRYSPVERAMLAPRLQINRDGEASVLWISAGAPERGFLVHYATAQATAPDRIEEVALGGQGSRGS